MECDAVTALWALWDEMAWSFTAQVIIKKRQKEQNIYCVGECQ